MADGLEAVFLENRDALQRFVTLRGGGDAAEDIVQEIWLRVAAHTSGPIANPRSYLFRMAHNLMIDRYRSEHQRGKREEAWGEDAVAHLSDGPDGAMIERVQIARSQLRQVEQELDLLGEPTGTIFRKFRIEGVAQKQIAHDFGLSLPSIEKHLQKAYRAMIALKQRMDME